MPLPVLLPRRHSRFDLCYALRSLGHDSVRALEVVWVSHRSYIITIKCCHRNAANEFQIFVLSLVLLLFAFLCHSPAWYCQLLSPHTHPFGFGLTGFQSISHLVTAIWHLPSQTKRRIDDDNNDVSLLGSQLLPGAGNASAARRFVRCFHI